MKDSRAFKGEENLSQEEDISILNCSPEGNFFSESRYLCIPTGTKAAPAIDYSICQQPLNHFLTSDISGLVIFSNSIKNSETLFPKSKLISSKGLNLGSSLLSYCISSIWQMEDLYKTLISTCKQNTLLIGEWLNEVYDVRPFFILAKKYLKINSDSRLIVTGFKRESEDLPAGYFRQWNQREMRRLLKSAGFLVEDLTTAESSQYLFVCKFNSEHYQQFIQAQFGFNYESSQLKRLVLTLELSNVHKTGGIGTSLYNQLLVSAPKSTLFLYLGPGEINSEHRRLGIFSDKDLLPEKFITNLSREDRAYQAFLQTYFYFNEIDLLQLHDYLGIGIKIIQGRHAATVSQNISIQTVVFGSMVYLENANHSWTGLNEIPIVYREKQALQDSDEVVFITEFLRDLYDNAGYEIDPEKIKLLRDPKPLRKIKFKSFRAIDTLIFIGRMNKMKGFDDFLKVALRISESNAGINIRIYAPETEINEETIELYERLKKTANIKQVFIDNDQLVRELEELSPNYLAFYPYTAENYPNALFEAIYSGGSYVGYKTGGIPEIIPLQFHDYCLAEPNPKSLFELANNIISMEPVERQKRFEQIAEYRNDQQQSINSQFDFELNTRRNRKPHPVTMPNSDITVIVPCYKTDLQMVRDLCFGLNSQILPPQEIIFVDDASGDGYYDKLSECITTSLRVPFRIFTYPRNLGLAGARNHALSKANTRYIAAIDSDNIPKPDYILKIMEVFSLNPDTAVVATCSTYFEEQAEWNTTRMYGGFSPLGAGLIFSQYRNIIADANSGYSTEILRKYGGWNQSNKYPLEDMELFSKLICQGEKIMVVPEELLLYRVRNNSLSRQSDTYPGDKRQAVSISLLPRFENYRLKGMISNLINFQVKLDQSFSQQTSIHAQYSSKIRELSWELENYKTHCENYRKMLKEYKSIYPNSRELKSVLMYRGHLFLKTVKSLAVKILNKISNSAKG